MKIRQPGTDPGVDRISIAAAVFLLAWVIITIIYGQAIKDRYQFVRLWDWKNLTLVSLAIPLLLWQSRAGLPPWHGGNIPSGKKWLTPFIAGMIFGIADVLLIKGIQHPEPYGTMPPFLQPFPYSIFLYTSGALDIEIFYRLLPITVAAWIGKRWCSPQVAKRLLWTVVVLSSLREPLEQWPDGSPWFVVYSLVSGFAMNLLQAFCMVRFGFLSALLVRLGHYTVWHILLGIYVQFVEKAAL